MSKKILIIRFSSIGDIVLTTPVLRVLRARFPDAEIHYLTKPQLVALLKYNPNLNEVLTLKKTLWETFLFLRKQKYDYILDLHNNLRSNLLTTALMRPKSVLDKQNTAKYKIVKWKQKIVVPHIVSRYLATLQPLGITEPDDGGGLDIFLPEAAHAKASNRILSAGFGPILAVVLGATYPTKQWITEYYTELLNKLALPCVLLGGKSDKSFANQVKNNLRAPFIDAVGESDLLETAALIAQCEIVLTPDTGLMHVAAALQKKVVSIWGNTTPALGFAPYRTQAVCVENLALNCRPCDKLGKKVCPKGHFRCMRDLTSDDVLQKIIDFMPNNES